MLNSFSICFRDIAL